MLHQCNSKRGDYMSGDYNVDMKHVIAEKLFKARKGSEMSQSELADQMGISKQSYSRYENGNREISFSQGILMAKTLNISIISLVPDELLSTPDFLLSSFDIKAVKNLNLSDQKTMREFSNVVQKIIKF